MHFSLFLTSIPRTKLIPEPSSQETLSTFGKAILDDVDTSDFSVRCNTKNFQVHKAVLCSRSPVFRSSILTPMLEAARGEIFVQDLGEKALGTILNYVYTGELELGEDSDILELAWGGNKYLLPGFMELLGYRLQMMKEELTGRMIADLLIAAHRHGAEDLRKIALVRIRADKEIISDEAFRANEPSRPKHYDGYCQRFVDFCFKTPINLFINTSYTSCLNLLNYFLICTYDESL